MFLFLLLFLDLVKIPKRQLPLTFKDVSSSEPGPAGLWSHLHGDTCGGQDAFCTGLYADLNILKSWQNPLGLSR